MRPLLAVVCGLALAVAGDAAAVTAGGVTVDVVATQSWGSGFNGAVRFTNGSFPGAVTAWQAVFKFNGSVQVQGTGWHGTISAPDASGNITARNAPWITSIGVGQTADEGFTANGAFSGVTFVSLTVNGQSIPLGGTTDTTPPTVSLASSATSVTTAQTITLTAAASDDVGVARVELYDGATLLVSDTSAPYSTTVALTSASNGTKSYTARAFDAAGNSTTSAAVSVVVNISTGDTTPPTVSLASSATNVTTAQTITLTATASDDVGVTRVELYDGTTLLVSDTSAPYSTTVALTSANNGTKSYTARAYDAAGNNRTSTAVSVVVNISSGDTTPPTVSIRSSVTSVTFARTITLTATASDNVGVTRVEFYDGTALLGTDTTSPYTRTVSLTSANNGTKSYTARAFDAAGNNQTSTPVTVTVNIAGTDTTPPTVSLASSATNVTTAQTITLTATASDNVGVTRVELYDGSTLLVSDTSAPYSTTVALTSANNGTKSYTARAYDAAGNNRTSTAVSVVVNIGTIDDPPSVSLASSATSVTVASTITLTATATDDRGLSRIEFYEGTTLLGSSTSSPSTRTVAFTQANNGTHSYTARAYDTANQTANSAPVSVVVNIGGTNTGYELDPPDVCYAQYWNQGCDGASPTCGGRCQTANACSPPESPQKSTFPMTFACPRFMLFSDEFVQAAQDDWGASPPFAYGVVGHDADSGGLDTGTSTCCQCYQLVFDRPEGGSAQPPELPYPPPMIVQSFNTAAGGGKNFDIYMGAGGFGAFNACVPGTYTGTSTTNFPEFMYTSFPTEYPTTGGIKAINIPECKVNGGVTAASMQSAACQNKIAQLCNNTASASATMTAETKQSCIQSNAFNAFYHQNWQVRVKRVECPLALTRVTGCRLAPQGLPQPNPNAKTPATADSSFRTGYTTTTMQDCCKPSCAWKDQVTGAGLQAVDKWTSFYSCDKNGQPITAP